VNTNNAENYTVRTFEYPGITVRAYIPVLAEEDRTKRMKKIHKQAANLLKKAK
jgi:hypothetical protein